MKKGKTPEIDDYFISKACLQLHVPRSLYDSDLYWKSKVDKEALRLKNKPISHCKNCGHPDTHPCKIKGCNCPVFTLPDYDISTMSWNGKLVPINSKGMREVIDAYNKLEAKLSRIIAISEQMEESLNRIRIVCD